MAVLAIGSATAGLGQQPPVQPEPAVPGIVYTNHHVASVPWSIHVVQVARSSRAFEIHSANGDGGALGLSTLTDQIERVDASLGVAVAAINGDYYQRDRTYAGDPRGLQIITGEVVSAPVGGACFWIDVLGEPHAGNVVSRFQVSWPDGATNSVGLNEDRPHDGLVLYTRAAGSSTRTEGGRELILERGDGPWLPLRMGRTYKARVAEVRETGNTPLKSGMIVLSLGPVIAKGLAKLEIGSTVTISTGSSPDLRGARTAIGGGPVLVRDGRRQKLPKPAGESYEFSSMMERHPRTAIGWNAESFFLVEVDGRQKGLSVGMTLEELTEYLVALGCEGAMNLDGGGSATLWCNGLIRNRPCDGEERPIANSLIVVRKPSGSRRMDGAVEKSDR